MHLAAFVTAHGFGHAGRASAVLGALHARRPDLTVDVFTSVPAGFLGSSISAPFRRIDLSSDHGMVQRGPFEADLGATARAVGALVEGFDRAAEGLAEQLRGSRCDVVLCDIDPVGIVAAERAGIPSVLVENFRWDWIFAHLPEAPPELVASAARMGEVYRRASLHLQVAPACDRVERAVQVDQPVARAARRPRSEARAALGLRGTEPLVLVTSGGVPGEPGHLNRCLERPDVTFLVTGAERTGRDRNLVRLAQEEPLYLPDLIRASDAVVAKLGYSTLAETWREGRPLLRVPRSAWPEGPVLTAWADAHVPGFEVSEDAFRAGEWVERLDELLALPLRAQRERAGQDEVAERILELVG